MYSDSFREISSGFKAVMLDSYGVLKNYQGLIPGIQQMIDFFQSKDILIRVLTNDSSRSQEQQANIFKNWGLRGIAPEQIITSGMMAKQFLEYKVLEGKIAYLGTENAAEYILQSGLQHIDIRYVELEDCKDITAFVFLDDEGFDWNQDINKVVNLLRRRNIPVIVANSDKLYPVSKNDVSIATGGIAQLVESILNRRFIHFGKPDSQMFSFAFEDLNKERRLQKDEILMVGDTLHTDILGGNKFGVKTLLVLSGNTSPENVDILIRSTGIIPDYICTSVNT